MDFQSIKLESPDREKVHVLAAVFMFLVCGYFFVAASNWSSSSQAHTLIEAVSCLVALFTGTLALVRFYSKKDSTFLFIGVGFLGTAMLDGYHAVVTSSFFAGYLPSGLSSLIPWSWIASRVYLSFCLAASWWAWRRENRLGGGGQIRETLVYACGIGLTVACFLFFAFVPLPRAYYPELFFHRPEEFLPAAFFLIALAGYLNKAQWRTDQFESWLILSLVVSLVAQALYMSRSAMLFDGMFDAAHMLKAVTYVIVCVGLLCDVHRTYCQNVEHNESLRTSNEGLRARTETLFLEIAERRQVESQLKQSEEHLSMVIESVGDAVVSADAEGRILLVNKRTEELFGYPREEMIGQFVEMFLPQERRAQHVVDRQGYMSSPQPFELGGGRDLFAVHKDGSHIPVEFSLAPMLVHGEVHVLATIVDITSHRKSKQALRDANEMLAKSNHELEQFAYIASHDLQEPLRKIASYAQLLREDCGQQFGKEGHDYLDVVIGGATRLRTLVSDLLTLSRITTRGMPLSATPANECLQGAIENLELAIQEGGALISYEPLPLVIADEGQLILLFQNLLGNALKYRGEATPEIHVSARDLDTHFEISIQDNGIGIDPQFNERIFDIFQRLHNRREYKGTGIGLALCKRIVERFDGQIGVDSVPGEGSRFHFTIRKADRHAAHGASHAGLESVGTSS